MLGSPTKIGFGLKVSSSQKKKPPPTPTRQSMRPGPHRPAVLVARLARSNTQRAQCLLVKLARMFPHPHNRPNHAPHFFLAKPQHFAHHARILLHPPHPRINFLNKLSYAKRLSPATCFPVPPGQKSLRQLPICIIPLSC